MKKNVLGLAFITIVSTGVSAQLLQHEVENGETLYGIARRYELSLERLATANELESPELLLPGTLLTIPTRYTVEKGDTLFSIARRFGSTVEELTRENRLTSSSIRVGQVLVLPPEITIPDQSRSTGTIATSQQQEQPDNPTDNDLDTGESDETGGNRSEPIVVAAEVSEPLNYAEGGVWPVAGNRRMLDGKLPGVMIRA
ncbi:MAG TPA: LysM peptidoglycan-binding domain-containing protein, partial [Tichowtungia sp.]|nr:LysM peptidoglycan-binding domain-containing protein [Tichowtungia sp.]